MANWGAVGEVVVVMAPLYNGQPGRASGSYPIFRRQLVSVSTMPLRMANSAASVRVVTPSLA